MTALLQRLGGVLIRPKATIAGLAPGVGASDGLVLLALYGIGAKLEPLGRGVADFQASEGISAIIALTLGLVAFLPWVLTTLAVELVLGRDRQERTELCKVPLALCAAAAGLADHLGLALPGPVYVPELIGAAWSIAIAAWVRPAVIIDGDASPAAPAPARGRLAAIAGVLFLGLLAANALADARFLRERWSTLAPLSAGAPVQPFEVDLLGGGHLGSDELGRGVHLLVFWTTWCGVCEAEMPMMVELGQAYADRGLRVVAVNADSGAPDGRARRSAVEAYRDAHTLPLPIALDPGIMRGIFRVRVFPHLVLIKDGEVRHMHQGRTLESTLRSEIEALLGAR